MATGETSSSGAGGIHVPVRPLQPLPRYQVAIRGRGRSGYGCSPGGRSQSWAARKLRPFPWRGQIRDGPHWRIPGRKSMTSFDPHDTSSAMAQLDRVKSLLSSSGVRFLDLSEVFGGVGIAVASGETEYVVITVMVGAEAALWVSSGVLKDVAHERLPALEACNRWNQSHAGYPCYLHDADSGWDVLMQQHYPLQLALDVPLFFKA